MSLFLLLLLLLFVGSGIIITAEELTFESEAEGKMRFR